VVKVLAIRVQFQTDTLETTTGDGTFNSGIPMTTQIDPVPHSREYFLDQLLFLKNFYEDVSGGQVTLDIANAVYPLTDTQVYQLPYQMWHYNHNDEDYLDTGLSLLFRDAWQAADTQNADIDFSQFNPDIDCFIIFHAGIGKDFALDFDPTPFDIPSAYMELEDLEAHLPEDIIPGLGLPVEDGQSYIRRGMILPETENQEGYELGMHGHMALLFGHHIGMPNLYNTQTGGTVTGWFELMDQGSGKMDGLIPAPPSAWTKVFMGWSVLITISSFPDTLEIPLGTIYKIPITNQEYFLVENINSFVRPGVSWDSLQYSYYVETGDYPVTWDLLTDSVSQYMNITIDPETNVLTDIDNWGVGRPASGIMIWHIDDNIIDTAIANNHINVNSEHLGVYLEEADGAMDIGQNYNWFSPGWGTELGSPFDAFYQDNPQHLDANPGNDLVMFGDNTFPDAKSNSGAYTHLLLKDFSPIGDTMSFITTNEWLVPGFPKPIYHPITAIFSASFDSSFGDELCKTQRNYLTVWNWEGEEIIYYNLYTWPYLKPAVYDFDNDGRDEIAMLTHSPNSVIVLNYNPEASTITKNSAPLLETEDANFLIATDTLLYSAFEDILYCWKVLANTPVLSWTTVLIDTGFGACLLPDNGIAIRCGMNKVSSYAPQGDLLWTQDFSASDPTLSFIYNPIAGDIDRDLEIEIILLGHRLGKPYILSLNSSDGTADSNFTNLPLDLTNSDFASPPSLSDLDDDGFLELCLATVDNEILALKKNGFLSDYSPFKLSTDYLIGYPIVINENFWPVPTFYNLSVSSHYLFYLSEAPFSQGILLNGVDVEGQTVQGFPILIDDLEYNAYSGPLISQGHIYSRQIAVANTSHIYQWNLLELGPSTSNPDFAGTSWSSLYGDKANSGLIDTLFAPIPQSGPVMPDNLCYNWPNPNNPGENFTNIRYYLNYDSNIKIDILDTAGDKVDELHDIGTAQNYNETLWNLTNIASGVYYARVEANSSVGKAVKIIKIAVIK
jgi:M6 family metalloprotease-like protein